MMSPGLDVLQSATIGYVSSVDASAAAPGQTTGAVDGLFAELLAAMTNASDEQTELQPSVQPDVKADAKTDVKVNSKADTTEEPETETKIDDTAVPTDAGSFTPEQIAASIVMIPQVQTKPSQEAADLTSNDFATVDTAGSATDAPAKAQPSAASANPTITTAVTIPVEEIPQVPIETQITSQPELKTQGRVQIPVQAAVSVPANNTIPAVDNSTVKQVDEQSNQDLFTRWSTEGKLAVTDERTPVTQPIVRMTETGRMLAQQLLGGPVAPDGSTVTVNTEKLTGRKATNSPDFSARGPALRISPEASVNASDLQFNSEVKPVQFLQTGVQSDPSVIIPVGQTAQKASFDQPVNDHVMDNTISLDLESKVPEGNGGFSAVLHSQGPVHAASDKPSEVILDRPRVAEKVINQIVSDVKLHIKNDDARMTLRLDPPQLGMVKVEIISRDGAVTASLKSTSEVTRNLLETNLPALKDALSQAGIKVDSFNVSSGLDFNQFNDHQNEAWNRQGFAQHRGGFQNQETELDPAAVLTMRTPAATSAAYSWLA